MLKLSSSAVDLSGRCGCSAAPAPISDCSDRDIATG